MVQSSAYALLAMLYFKEAGVDVPKEKIGLLVQFLSRQKQQEKDQIYWKGGVFFSGGTVVRNVLYFTSDAYTTALIALGFQKFLQLY